MDTPNQAEGVTLIRSNEQGMELMNKMVAMASPETVYGQPVVQGETIVIPASESVASLGFGFGYGYGTSQESSPADAVDSEASREVAPAAVSEQDAGGGGGGGGGGYAASRPVGVLEIRPEGVRFVPIVDVTKLGLAMFTTLGAMFLMARRMRRPWR